MSMSFLSMHGLATWKPLSIPWDRALSTFGSLPRLRHIYCLCRTASERLFHLILYGGFALGRSKRSPTEQEKQKAMATLMRHGWGMGDPAFRQMFTSQFIPEATKEQADWFNDLQRNTTSPECAARYFEVVGSFDVSGLLAQVRVPTLVMHVRDDLMVPIDAGRQLAAGIPGARFIALPGRITFF